MLGNFARTFRYYRDQMRNILGLGVLSLLSANFQTAALVLVVPLATAISKGEGRFTGRLGPLKVSTTTSKLAILAATAIVVAAVIDISASWARSRAMSKWEYVHRELVIGECLNAGYPTQAAERLGTLGTLTSYINRSSAALGAIINGLGSGLSILIFGTGALLIDYRAALFLLFAV